MTNLLEKLRQLIKQSRKESEEQHMDDSAQTNPESIQTQENATADDTALNATLVKNLMEMLDHTYEGMYSCEETFALLDEYVELIAEDDEAAELMPYVQRHLDNCPDCHEVYATLLNIIQPDPPTTTEFLS
jgi:hypothetical protein